MAKSFKIAIAPTFKSVVQVPRVGGDPLAITFTFKALDRRALAKLFTKWQKEQEALIEGIDGYNLEELADKEIEMQVVQLKDIVVGWGFDDEFNDENIEALVATAISVTSAIIDQYGEAYSRARTGN